MPLYALVMRLTFFDAHFKVHYTKGFRATYPIPLPTTVAGIFASMLGLERDKAAKLFKKYRFGAILIGEITESVEEATYMQFPKNRLGVAPMQILVNPSYYIAVASNNKEDIAKINKDIEEGIEYFPFGGQNDFFAKDWSILGIKEVYNSKEIGNYAYSEYVQELTKGTTVAILPVMHRFGYREEFYFILNGSVIVKQEMPVCKIDGKNIALYKLQDFYPVGEWSNEYATD